MKESFGDRLFKLRTDNGLTQDELADAIEKKFPDISVDKPMISRYENRKSEPKRFEIVQAFSEFFKVSISYIMGRVDNPFENKDSLRPIPILGTIAAGIPILAQEDILGHEYVPLGSPVEFCLKVKGDSMINARILDGDLVFIRPQPDVENGEIAAVLINGNEATLKRVYKMNGTIILRAENPNIKEIIISKKDNVEVSILGKAIQFKSEVR